MSRTALVLEAIDDLRQSYQQRSIFYLVDLRGLLMNVPHNIGKLGPDGMNEVLHRCGLSKYIENVAIEQQSPDEISYVLHFRRRDQAERAANEILEVCTKFPSFDQALTKQFMKDPNAPKRYYMYAFEASGSYESYNKIRCYRVSYTNDRFEAGSWQVEKSMDVKQTWNLLLR